MTNAPDTASEARSFQVGPLTRTDFVKFAAAGGDFNPLHHDEIFAKEAGFPSVFAMGMLTAGLASRLLTDWFGVAAVRSYAVRFKAMVWPGDILTVEGRVSAVQADRQGYLQVKFTVANTDGQVKLTGTAEITGQGAARESLTALLNDEQHIRSAAMPDDPKLEDRIGETIRSLRFPVEPGKIREFARAVKDTSPIYHDEAVARANGLPGIVAPLTFSVVSAHYGSGDAMELPAKLGLNLQRLVHGEHTWTFQRPLDAGETLDVVTTITKVERKAARGGAQMTMIEIRTEYHDANGELVISEIMLMIELPP